MKNAAIQSTFAVIMGQSLSAIRLEDFVAATGFGIVALSLVIDNKSLLGCTGGALWSDEFRPGPIYLQDDHTGVQYRNIVLRPIVK